MTHDFACTVYFDGGCPVCSREIAAYRRLRGGESIFWVDASACEDAALNGDLDRVSALQRLHVRCADGTLVSGAAAFVELWKQLPAFAWLARVCSIRPLLAILEALYSGFLRMRRSWRTPATRACSATPEKPFY